MTGMTALVTFLCSITLCSSVRNLSNYIVLHLEPSTNAQMNWVRNLHTDASLDFWSVHDVMVDTERGKTLKQQLKQKGIASSTLIPNVQATIDAERTRQRLAPLYRAAGPISFDKYYRYDEIVAYLQYIAKEYPEMASLHSMGISTEGRQLYYIYISTGGNETRPLIIIDATYHAREWLAAATALFIIQQLVENPANADLIAEVDWHVIPLINPDGYEYSHTTDRMWRKTRSKHTCHDDTHSGVDANRNFDHDWGGTGSSSFPCQEVYEGPHAFSEPETRAFSNHALSHARRTRLYLSLHSFGNYILYPWGYTMSRTDDWRKLDEVGKRAKAAIIGAGGAKSWTVGLASKEMYIASGTSPDWVRHDAGVGLSYTVELQGGGNSGFDLPASRLGREVSYFFPAVRVFGEHVADPFYDLTSMAVDTHCLPTFMLILPLILLK